MKVMGITPGEWVKQEKQARSSTTVSLESAEAWPIFDFGSILPFDSTFSASASTPTSVESTEDFDSMLNVVDFAEQDWLNMIDFDALGESIDWIPLPT